MIYLDNHSTTPLAPEALDAMLPFLQEQFANAGSLSHQAGRLVAEQVEAAVAGLASHLSATHDEIVVTSGATESNNLALFGVCLHPRQKRRKIVSLTTEHKAILDPLSRLEKLGFEVVRVDVGNNDSSNAGRVNLQQLTSAVDDQTALVTVMLANNEIGVVQPLREIAALCRRYDAILHTDASQAVGRIPVDVDQLDVDLLSFSAHKFYGPKGVGGLFVRRRQRRVKLQAQVVGGGQQHGFRSGTLNTSGIVGMAAALNVCANNMSSDQLRIARLRNRLWAKLQNELELASLNGPTLTPCEEDDEPASDKLPSLNRMPDNLNCSFYPIEGQSLMLAMPELCVSSGSACTSAAPYPSHVLQAIGLSEDQARSSLRFGIGRYNSESEIDQAAIWIVEAAQQMQKLL